MVLGGWRMLYTDNDVAELPTIREAIDAAIKAKLEAVEAGIATT